MARRSRRTVRAKSLLAAATRIDIESKEDAQLQRKVRQNWQIQAWTYYDSIPEVGFAVDFTAHCMARMRIFVAALPNVGETGTPVDVHDPDLAVPPAIISACDNALRDLGNGRLELSKMMENLSLQITIAGEGFLLGVTDPMTQKVQYSIRSISEVVVNDDQIELREGPMTNQGVLGLVPLPPDTMVTRLWNPHPQYRLLAQSRFRALLDTFEDLMILRRMIRATGRNRLAGRGLLLMPTEANLPIFDDDDESTPGATWYDEFTNATITPIRNEGDASAVVPMVTEMGAEYIEKVRWIEFTSTFDEHAPAVRDELMSTVATGLDLPKELLTGLVDLNHWCVTDDHEILTKDGWAHQDDVGVGTEVLTLNHETGMSEWQPIRDMYRARVSDEPMLAMKSGTHSSISTPNHRWPTLRQGHRRWATSEELTDHDMIVRATVSADIPAEAKWTDAFVELLAWYWTEGSAQNGMISIAQSHGVNPERVVRIRKALIDLYGPAKTSLHAGRNQGPPGWREAVQANKQSHGGPVTVFYLNTQASRPFIDAAPDKCVRSGIIREMTMAQLALFIDVSMQGDGQHYRQGRLDIFQSDDERLDALDLAGTLAGYSISRRAVKDGYRLNLSQAATARPVKAANEVRRIGSNGATAAVVPYTGTIWCPVTDNQTWFARHDGHSFYTGNTAWTVDANTLRYHLEPHAVKLVDLLTIGHLRPYLTTATDAMGMPLSEALLSQWIDRLLFWYDPTELVTPPDLSQSALSAYDAGVLSAAALRKYLGMSEEDAPSSEEKALNIVSKTRNWPVNVLLALLHQLYPQLDFPPVAGPPAIPGVKGATATDKGGVIEAPPEPVDGTAPPALPPGPTTADLPKIPELPNQPGPPEPPITASAADKRLAWQLVMLDRELRARIQVAACKELRRHLERLGTKLRSRVAKNTNLRKKIAMTHNEHVAMMLGAEVVKASGFLTTSGMLDTDWADLKKDFLTWTKAAQHQSVAIVAKAAHLSPEKVAELHAKNDANAERGWEVMRHAMDTLGASRAYNPNPNVSDEEAIANLNPDTVVPNNVVRAALAVAGGMLVTALAQSVYANNTVVPTIPSASVTGGVSTGSTITQALSDAGTVTDNYEWVHGPSDKPFEPHEDLDGQEFASYDDPVLANDGDWPPVPFFYPGDHDGSVAAGTVVEGSTPRALSLRWHEGEMVELATASGQFLTVTPNHPVLTDRGWVGAGNLVEGDHVLRGLDAQRAARLIPDDHQVPARVEDLFAALWVRPSVIARGVPVAAKDFHGDGGEGQVAVVAADGDLRLHAKPAPREPLSQDQFAHAAAVAEGLASARSAFEGLVAIGPSSLGLEGELGEPSALLRRASGTEQELRIAHASWLDAHESQPLGDRVAIHAEALGQSQDALAGFVELDKLIQVNRLSGFKGHVFDLQTDEHWYFANGILVHNCLCDAMPLWVTAPSDEG